MQEPNDILPLTDETVEAVNRRLWKAIKQGNIRTLQASLSPTIKQKISYDAMKRYIDTGLKKFNKRKMMSGKEAEDKLKIRITPHQFLLSNILKLLGMTFEDLFNVDQYEQLEIQVDEDTLGLEVDEDDESPVDTMSLLQSMDKKLDKIIGLNTITKKKSYIERFADVNDYLSAIQPFFLIPFLDPHKNGLSIPTKEGIPPFLSITTSKMVQINNNTSKKSLYLCTNQYISECHRANRTSFPNKTSSMEIYIYEYFFLEYFASMVHKKSRIHLLLQKMYSHGNTEVCFGRLLSPFFILAIFFDLMNNFIKRGQETKKDIFSQLTTNNKHEKVETKEIMSYCKENIDSIYAIIDYILESDIPPKEELCIEYEKTVFEFFTNIKDLFTKQIPIQKTFSDIMGLVTDRKVLEGKLLEIVSSPGDFFSCYITELQIETLKNFPEKIQNMQIRLEDYYRE